MAAELLSMRMSFLAFPNTGATVSRAEAWAKIIAGIAANTEAPNWYTCVGIPERKIRSSLQQYLSFICDIFCLYYKILFS